MEELSAPPEEKKLPAPPEEKLLRAPTFWEKYWKFRWLILSIALILIFIPVSLSLNKTSTPPQSPQPNTPTQPSPTTTIDPTANRKTFSGVGISFKYPSNYNLDQTNSSRAYITLYSPVDPNRQPVPVVQGKELKLEIVVETAGQNETLSAIFNEIVSSIKTMGEVLEEKDTSINNIPAKYLKTYQVEEYVLLASGKKIVIMKYPVDTSRQEEFNQILSTFKFTQ